MSGLPPRLQSILDDLSFFPERTERIQALISLADRYSAPDRPKPYPEEHRVPGCESEAFVWVETDSDGGLVIDFAVENPQGISAMAMGVILGDALRGEPPAMAARIPEEIVYEIFGRELSMGKSMGLMGMVRVTKFLAGRLAGRG